MKFTEQERDFLKQEFADLCHAAINSMITAGSFVRAIDRIEQIVSERLTIKPYHEHGNSVASDRTEPGESGQSADGGIAIMEILQPIHRHPFDAESGREMEIWYTHKDVWNAMTTYASQVCADKDARIKELEGLLSSDSVYGLFRFAYKSPESAQVYEISKKLRELKTK